MLKVCSHLITQLSKALEDEFSRGFSMLAFNSSKVEALNSKDSSTTTFSSSSCRIVARTLYEFQYQITNFIYQIIKKSTNLNSESDYKNNP